MLLRYEQFRGYIHTVDTLGPRVAENTTGPRTYDVILVDGRARVPAAIKALQYLNPNGVVMVHDACRSKYHQLRDFYELDPRFPDPRPLVGLQTFRSLYVLRPRAEYKPRVEADGQVRRFQALQAQLRSYGNQLVMHEGYPRVGQPFSNVSMLGVTTHGWAAHC